MIMKKIIIAAVIALGTVIAANAQPRAIGGRLGYSLEASYQHTVGGADFIEANLGTFGYQSLNASAIYNFMIAQPAWTARGEWGFYAGPGLAIGTGFSDTYAFNLDFAAQVGLEYTFWFPLQLSVDLRPQFGVRIGDEYRNGKGRHASYDKWGLYGFAPTLSVRYRF